MNAKLALTVLSSLKLSVDSIHLLRRIGRTSLNAQDWIGRFVRFTPALLENTLACGAPPETLGEWFSQAVSHFRFGAIFKLTGRDRTNLADREVLRLAAEFESPRLLEVGVSDGSSALGLLRQRQRFAQIVLTDRHNVFFRKRTPLGTLFYDSDRNLKLLKMLCFSLDLTPLGLQGPPELARIETANPALRTEFAIPAIQRFDLFRDVLTPPFQVIKCANLLNCSYFTDDELRRGVANIARSLCEGGHLVVSQNNERYRDGEAVFVLRKRGAELNLVLSINDHDAARLFPARQA